MSYSMMTDEEILRDLAERIEKLRLVRQMKETDLEKASGVSRKTLYNFRRGTGISMKNFIRILKAVGEADRLALMFPESDGYRPSGEGEADLPRRVRDKQNSQDFTWGDEK